MSVANQPVFYSVCLEGTEINNEIFQLLHMLNKHAKCTLMFCRPPTGEATLTESSHPQTLTLAGFLKEEDCLFCMGLTQGKPDWATTMSNYTRPQGLYYSRISMASSHTQKIES